jgi:two-component system response regulator YesN
MNATLPAQANRRPATHSEIFVVDDDAMIVTLLDALLHSAGYEPRLFRDPEALLEAMGHADHPPRVLITDLEMGRLTGLDVIERCRALHPELKTILVSGSVDDEFARSCRVPPDRFFAKPFQAPELLSAVRQLMES